MSEPKQLLVSSHSQSEPAYAGFWIRFLAFCIDVVIVQIGLRIISLVLLPFFSRLITDSHVETVTEWSKWATKWANRNFEEWALGIAVFSALVFVAWAICWPYYAFMESSDEQATLGKRICRLKLARKDGARVSFVRSSARFFAKMVHVYVFSWLGLLVSLLLIVPFLVIGYFFSFFLGVGVFVVLPYILLIAMPFAFGSVGYLTTLFSVRKQTLHDLIAGTIVVKAD